MSETQLILGLPKAGKTTFIAALWYVVETLCVPGSLQLVDLPEDRRHLNELRTRWVNCLEQIHTSTSTEKEIRLKLKDPATGRIVELIVPDLSGESLELQWSHRQCTRSYFDLASSATSILLFVNAESAAEAATIGEEEALGDMLREIPRSGNRSVSDALTHPEIPCGAREVPWDCGDAPPQVKLVEILQFLTAPPFRNRIFRSVVIISAWDRVKSEGLSPAVWLAKRMPLLDQFLRANKETFQSEVYGLSATGGRMQTDAERKSNRRDPQIESLQSHQNQGKRIEVVGPSGSSHDITAPVRCAIT